MTGGEETDARPARVLVVGDVHGDFASLARWSAAVRRERGPLDAVLSVGDLEPHRDEADAAGAHGRGGLGDFPRVVEGAIDLGAPLYFIGGNHEPWPALDDAGPGRWGGVARFLGRSGVGEVAGLRVAFLSGIYAARVTDAPGARRETAKDRTYYTREEVERVGLAAQRAGDVDILLTHDWPSGIAGPRLGAHVGRPELRALCERVRPRWHFCGHMHRPHRASIGPAEVVCLAHIRSGYAALAVIEREAGGPPVRVRGLGGRRSHGPRRPSG
ncbi:metallophosphoesterase family protein [Planobispora longispora]|uniref:Metallophosphoesterase n=1 Tax=Planobispora longispora TaxID=28887 RepID=A0A8J3RFH4_9ACTN|nr:metallophosphoesterase [Planobispora longispora]GIH73765.1 metallophosphoesterase [Planobispora longispora]